MSTEFRRQPTGPPELDDSRGVSESVRTVLELFDAVEPDELDGIATDGERVTVHGHRHSNARDRDRAPANVLQRACFEPVTIESTCRGVAGGFDYETEHYDVSMTLGRELIEKRAPIEADVVGATGASCTQQHRDRSINVVHSLTPIGNEVE